MCGVAKCDGDVSAFTRVCTCSVVRRVVVVVVVVGGGGGVCVCVCVHN